MKVHYLSASRIIISLILMLGVISLVWPSHGAIEKEQVVQPIILRGRAKTIPFSNTLIKLRFTTDGKQPVYATQFDGGLIRIEEDKSLIYGFSPFIIDQAAGDIAIRVFQISRIEENGEVVDERMEELQILEPIKAGGYYLTTYRDSVSFFTIEVVEIKKDSKSAGKIINPQSGGGGEECCVECEGRTTCSCEVSTACGGCCHPACCSFY
jgi:hypothetical protein